jgi:acyl dehydratase
VATPVAGAQIMQSTHELLYLDDLSVGQRFTSGTAPVDAPQIEPFASAFDLQPFHLDERAANRSVFGDLVASGWHTAAITMRLQFEGLLKDAGIYLHFDADGVEVTD